MEMGEEEQGGEQAMDGHGQVTLVPNNGAVIRIISPQDGAVFEKGSDVLVEIEYENFDLGQEGNHWHVYVDGQSHGMIMGLVTDGILRDLEPGEHEISAYLSIGTHEELEDGAAVTITVVE